MRIRQITLSRSRFADHDRAIPIDNAATADREVARGAGAGRIP
ncbi:hypothetical protein M2271_003182 [Streptomyces sp. LBL]|nr:hypothetical protein [Streptomyces sp. LBL]